MYSAIFEEIPVKIGSNKISISLNLLKSEVTSNKLIELVLNKCKLLTKKAVLNTYILFEHVNGIERRLNKNDNIIQLWLMWKAKVKQYKIFNDIKFVIRKYHTICNEFASKHKSHEKVKTNEVLSQQTGYILKNTKKIYEKKTNLLIQPKHNDEDSKFTQNISMLQYIYLKLKNNIHKNVSTITISKSF